MSNFNYKPSGVCASNIQLDIDNNIIKEINVTNGCAGNLLGIKSLVEGKDIDEVISKLEGIICGFKSTSCPDQIAKALKSYKNQ